MLELVKQRGLYDCGVACLAMALHTTYDDALALLGRDPNDEIVEFEGCAHAGVVPEEIINAAFTRGISCSFSPVYACYPEGTWQHTWQHVFRTINILDPASATFSRQGKYNAIIGVPSLNNDTVGHWIYVGNGDVFDPSLGKCYGPTDTLPVQSAVLFMRNV
jgi:hypothetical protein